MAAEAGTDAGQEALEAGVGRLPSELVFRPIQSRNLFEETIARLGQAIRLGVVPHGARFPSTQELAEQLGVSRITIREALRALEQAGFVEIRHGRGGGVYVLQSDPGKSKERVRELVQEMGSKFDDAIDFRSAIEPRIAELAAARRTDAQLASARHLIEESKLVQRSGFRGTDFRFHLLLAEMADSPTLAAAAAEIQLRLSEILSAMPFLDEAARHSIDQHEKILDEIEAGNATAAGASMLEHIDGTTVILRTWVEQAKADAAELDH